MAYNHAVIPGNFEALSWQSRFIWLTLCTFTRWDDGFKKGECWPTLDTLHKRTGLSVNTVKKGLQGLVDVGLVKVKRRGFGGRTTSTLYTLLPDVSTRDISPCDVSPRDDNVSPRDTLMYHHVTVDVSPRDNKQNKEQNYRTERENRRTADLPTATEGKPVTASPSSQGQDPTPDMEATTTEEPPLTSEDVNRMFDYIWKEYPNHQYEATARKKFRRVIPPGTSRAEAERILADMWHRLEEDAPRWAGAEGEAQFTPRFEKWLENSYGIE